MGKATDLAQLALQTGDYSPTYRLKVDGERFTEKLYECSVTYSADGGSELSIATDSDLTDLTGAKVTLEIGYGDDLWPYFGGWLEEPEDNHWGEPSTAVAYGPFKEMAEATIGEDVTYSGKRLGEAIVDLHLRAGRAVQGVKYEIRGNPKYLLEGETAGLSISTSFADGINALLEMAGWISMDRPNFLRVYRPKPNPRPSGKIAASYSEAHFPAGGFTAIKSKTYGSVGAFARDEEGNFKFPPVKVRVDSLSPNKPSELDTYWLEDWAGTESEAWVECGKLAALFADGLYSWSLSGISANPELFSHDIIRVHTTELREEGERHPSRYEVVYACVIDDEAQVDVSIEGLPMSLSGETAIKIREKKIRDPFIHVRGGYSSVVKS